MAVTWDRDLPRLWVAALPGDSLDLDYLQALSESQGLPLGALFLAEGADTAADLRAAFPGCEVLPLLPAAPTLTEYWDVISRYAVQRDVAAFLVRAGTTVPRGGWRRLQAVAGDPGQIVFPLGVRHALSSAFPAVDHAPRLDADAVDRWLNQYAEGLRVDIPEPGGHAGFLGGVRDDGGLQYILSDALYVDDSVLPPVAQLASPVAAYTDALLHRHPLTGVRHALGELSDRAEEPGSAVPRARAVNLHVSHGWGGGLARWIEDFCAADDTARSLVLRPIGDRNAFGQTIALYDAARPEVPLRTRTLATPIVSTALAHAEHAQFVADIVADYGVSTLFISSLIGHSLDLLRMPLPTLVVAHDFFPVCPAVIATFGEPCTSCPAERMEECLDSNPLQTFFHAESAAHWHAVRAAFERAARAPHLQFVAPSRSVADRLAALSEAHRERGCTVLPHGLPAPVADSLTVCRSASPRGGARPLVAVLGSAEAHKGVEMLPSICAELADCCDFLVLGYRDALDAMPEYPHVERVPRYVRSELGALLAERGVDLGLLLSTVPETFSFTLSELQAAAVPTIATRIGALGERIEHGVDGWLVEVSSPAVQRQLRDLAGDRAAIDRVRARLLAQPPREAAAMVDDYYTLLSPAQRYAVARPERAPRPQQDLSTEGALFVNPEATYAEVLADFVAFTRRRLAASPRVPALVRRLAQRSPRR